MNPVKWFRRNNNTVQASLRSFYDEVGDLASHSTRPLGTRSIRLQEIVGSVGRASELDSNFCFKGQGWTERHQRIDAMMRQGKPMNPIKVFLLRRGEKAEYFVMDGHHRVALAKRYGYQDMNAEVIEVMAGSSLLQ